MNKLLEPAPSLPVVSEQPFVNFCMRSVCNLGFVIGETVIVERTFLSQRIL